MKDSNNKNITPSNTSRLLGMNISQDMSWTNHMLHGEKAVLPLCKKKLGALYFIGRYYNTSIRMKLCNALIISRLIYGIQIWGLYTPSLCNAAQIVQNQAARWIFKLSKSTKIIELLRVTNWLSIYQLTKFHSLLSLWKIVRLGKPERLLQKLKHGHSQRRIRDERLQCERPRLQMTERRWRIDTIMEWNLLPAEIRSCTKPAQFRKRLRQRILETVPIFHPGE